MFNADQADRIAAIQQKISAGHELTAAEHTFQWWSHMNLMLHAETFFHHYELGLMPEGHWQGYVRYVEAHSVSPGFADFWREVGPAFSRNFCNWMTEIVNRNNQVNLPLHENA